MKPAVAWLNEVAETVAKDMFISSCPPGRHTEQMICKIQADALRWVHSEMTPARSPALVALVVANKIVELEK